MVKSSSIRNRKEVSNVELMVIDGNSILNRAFYGVRPLSTKSGQPTNALFGFLNILQKLLDENHPDALCVTFDVHAPTFRHKKYAPYKAQRKPMPEELRSQVPLMKEILDVLNIPRYEMEGWEADDLIGTISDRCSAADWQCRIVTGDRDALQLVTDRSHVLLVTTRMGQTLTSEVTPDAFREKYGFEPVRMIDLKALMGDSSDNYPGVKGIGEKTAMTLLQECGSLDEIYRRLDAGTLEAKPAVLRHLQEGREDASLSYDLARIRTDAPISFQPEDAVRKDPDRKAAYDLFLKLEFSKFIERFGLAPEQGAQSKGKLAEPEKIEIVTDPARAEELTGEWKSAPCVTVLALPDLSGVSVLCGGTNSILLEDRLGDAYDRCLEVLFSSAVSKTAHESKELMHLLAEHGLPTDGFVFDTALAAYLLSSTDGSYALERLSIAYLGRELPPASAYTAPGAFTQLSEPEKAAEALGLHTAAVASLRTILEPKLQEYGMEKLLHEIELPLCPVLADMELTGFLVDRHALEHFGQYLSAQAESDQEQIFRIAGHEFNINSTQQLGQVLFEELGLPPVKKTKKGYSTSAEVLEKLRGRHEIIDYILDYRQMTKLNSTYVEGLGKVIGEDGRIHTNFQNTVTATGRLSSTEPNLQNIPVRTELGAEMRKMFFAPDGCVLVDADYSQIELRLLAHMADDKAMIEDFKSGYDIHTATAAYVFGVEPKQVTREMRRSAKAVNFGMVYGISQYSLAKDIKVSVPEAKAYMERYFKRYSGVRAYMDGVVAQAKRDGYVSTLYGRRRWLPELRSSNFNVRSFGERVALNAPIQGTAADIMKLAMIRVCQRLRTEQMKAKMVLQVHDEIIIECPEAEKEHVLEIVREEMENVTSLSVPLVVDAKAGKTWADAH